MSETDHGLLPRDTGLSGRSHAILEFLLFIDRFKTIERQSFLTGASRTETDAEHTWHMCLYALMLHGELDSACDLPHVLKLILIHDLVEIHAGDAPAYDAEAQAAKEDLERQAAKRLFGMLPSDLSAELHALWEEFEAGDTAEARFAGAVDRLQALGQSILCSGQGWKQSGARRHQVETRMAPARAADPAIDRLVDALMTLADRRAIWPHPDDRQG
jgi:putative hydrolase of HD superfamily